MVEINSNEAVLRKILNTTEIRRLLGSLVPELLHVYAGRSRVKKIWARRIGDHLGKTLARSDGNPELGELLEDPCFVQSLLGLLPEAISAIFDFMETTAATVQTLDPGEKVECFENLVPRISEGRSGSLITSCCRILNDLHRENPEFFTSCMEPGFTRWIESVDFGEVREMVENSTRDIRGFASIANDAIWQYPAKVVLLLSLVPSMVNLLVDAAGISLSRLNDLPADLLTDVALSLVKEIEGAPAADLVNGLSELAKKIHIGSALLGDPGAPEGTRVLLAKIEEIVEGVDPIALWKAKIALAEIAASIDNAFADAVNSTPDLKKLELAKGPEIANIKIKTRNRKLSYRENMDEESALESVKLSLDAYDLQEAAETINISLRFLNRIADRQPEFFGEYLRRFAGAIDHYELSEAARHLFADADSEMKTTARTVVPSVVVYVCDILKSRDDEYEDEAGRARQALKALFADEEVNRAGVS